MRFGGRIGLAAYQLSEFDVTATGQDMRLRYPIAYGIDGPGSGSGPYGSAPIGFDVCNIEVDALPFEPHDVALHGVLTEVGYTAARKVS